ncbi:MAG: site-2 protease family protein [Jatrophihabitans sp.]|uniref:site-2 protease family protein n=1 Tax=Jatrophihabitans sp. TaxID=1932789 RepID=UPI003F809A0C
MSVYDWNAGGRRRTVVRPSPLFLIVLAVTVVGGLVAWFETGQGSRLGDLGVFVFVLAGWVVSVCFHEFAHAYAAHRAGDRSVESAGYLSLNPFKYAHPVLSLFLPLLFIATGGIGLPGGAVYLHPHMFRSKASRALASAVGPAVNLVLGVVLIAVANSADAGPHPRFWTALAFLGFLQITAAVLNLLPVPGLDGWGIIEPFVAPETRRAAEKIKPWGLLGVIVLLTIQDVNARFFELVNWVYQLFGGNDYTQSLAYFGRQFFRWWVANPL